MKTPMNDKEELVKEIKLTPLNDIEYIQITNLSSTVMREYWYPRYFDKYRDFGFELETEFNDEPDNIYEFTKSKQEMIDYIRKYDTNDLAYITVKYTKFKNYN